MIARLLKKLFSPPGWSVPYGFDKKGRLVTMGGLTTNQVRQALKAKKK